MTDADWGDLDQLPQKRPGTRLLFCGLGCLVPLLALFAGALWLKGCIEDAMNPELQWARLEELLPHDARPEGWTMRGGTPEGIIGWLLGARVFLLISQEDPRLRVTILQLSDASTTELFERGDPWVPADAEEPVETLPIQGRDLRVALVSEISAERVEGSGDAKVEFQYGEQVVAVEVTPDSAEVPIIVTFDVSAGVPLTPADITTFLSPFQLGPDR